MKTVYMMPLLKNAFPRYSIRGKIARKVYQYLKKIFNRGSEANVLSARSEEDIKDQISVLGIKQADILVQVDNFEAGGLENVVLDLADAVVEAGYATVLLVLGTEGAAVQRARDKGIPVILGSAMEGPYQKCLDMLRPRLIMAHYSFFGADLGYKLHIPFIQVIHNTYIWFNRIQREEFSRATDYTSVFIAVSEYAKRYTVRVLGVEEDQCIVIPNGINNAAFKVSNRSEIRREVRAYHGLSEEDFVFLSVGAINHQKNHIATVRAFASEMHRMPQAKLVLLGPAYEETLLNDIMGFVADRGLQQRVIYAGSTVSPERYYMMADAFVSAAFFEGGGLNHLEAARAGLPSIVTKVGYAAEFVGIPGFDVINPPVDIMEFDGEIWQLEASSEFDRCLAQAMVNTYSNRIAVDIPLDVMDLFDKANAYKFYLTMISELLRGEVPRGRVFASSWPEKLALIAGKKELYDD